MNVLDCESIGSIDKSLESIIGVPVDKIDDFLINFDCEVIYDDENYTIEDNIRDILAKEVSIYFKSKCDYDITCWFHITRAFNKDDFRWGILPLSKIIDKIWNDLFALVINDFAESEWIEFRKMIEGNSLRCHGADLYKRKLKNEILHGPYAILIKDLAFPKNHKNNIDFIDLPEIVADICWCFDSKYDYNLLKKYLANTQKYIVKFKSYNCDSFYLGSALIHKYRLLKGMENESYPVCCFNGDGKTVHANDILKIEEAATRPLYTYI